MRTLTSVFVQHAARVGFLLLGLNGVVRADNPPPSQVYYVPFSEDKQLEAFIATVAGGTGTTPGDPLAVFVTFSCATDNTVIYYDHWEDGYEVNITNPTQPTTEVYGDGNPANGFPPGNPGDLISAGTVFSLRNFVTTTTLQSVLDYDARDKVASHKPISLTKTSFPANVNTLLAGCVEVFEYGLWGLNYRSPVGVNMPRDTEGATLTSDRDIFQYSALYVSAGPPGATVRIDADNNGVFERTNTLSEGQFLWVTNINVGAQIAADRPVQTVLYTGQPASNYGSRDTSLSPTNRWDSSYYAPQSTTSSAATVVFLYNPATTNITVQYRYRSSASAFVTNSISVPAGGNRRVTLAQANGSTHFGAYQFFTAGTVPPMFYAFSATDADEAYGDGSNNRDWDGGYGLIGKSSLTTQVLLSLGIGRDPYSTNNLAENGNPLWITLVGNIHTQTTVYVDYNGDNAGPFTDPNTNRYDVAYSLRELQQQQLFDPDGNQSGMLVYVLNPNVKIAAAWGQDPSRATISQPGLDVATVVPPLREGDAGKMSRLNADADGDGFLSAGDTLEYDIQVINTARAAIQGPFTVIDNLPSNTVYTAGSTKYRISIGGLYQNWVPIPDDGPETAFPLDGSGYPVPGSLGVGQKIQIVFLANVKLYPDLTPGTEKITNTGSVEVSPFGVKIPLYWEDPLFGSLGDRVWHDADGEGDQDAGETGLTNVVVYLDLNTNGVRDASEPWDTTDTNGVYLIGGLQAGTYLVRVDPASVAAIAPGFGPTYDLDGIATSYRAVASLASAQDRTDVDFGFRLRASVGDRVWLDLDGDRNQDSGEPGINNVRVYIDSNGNNLFDAGETNSITFGDGTYFIGNLAAGTYDVRVDTNTLPAGATQTHDYSGALDHEGQVSLVGAEHNPNLDFGYRGALRIGDLVWYDVDGNGAPPITVIDGRVDINASGGLSADDDGYIGTMRVIDGRLDMNNDSSISAADNGTFQGTQVIAGELDINYSGTLSGDDDGNRILLPILQVIDGRVDINASGTVDGTDDGYIGTMRVINGYLDMDGDGSGTTPDGGDDGTYLGYPVIDGGLDINRNGSIGGTDAGQLLIERGIGGVRVFIDSNNNGMWDNATEPASVTTTNGVYAFTNLFNGTYTVRVDTSTLPASMFQTYDLTAPTTDNTAIVTLSGASSFDVDFGYRDDASLGDRVWNDLDGDRNQDPGEPGIAGILVYIDADDDNLFDQGVERFDYTDLNGFYSIGNLSPGTYSVRVEISTLPAGSVQTSDLTSPYTDHEATRTLVLSESATDVDFGYRSNASFGDFVWLDQNGDGVPDAGESGIGGIRIFVDINGNDTWDSATEPSATTDGNGAYAITNLIAGTYTARVDTNTLPAGLTGTYDLNGVLDNAATFSLSANQNRTDVDFGYTRLASLGDRAWYDANANGQQDGGEYGLGGVSVTLYKAADDTVAGTILTGDGGAYLFNDLNPGIYYVVFGPLSGYFRTTADQGADATDSDANPTTGRTPNVTLLSGQTNLTLDVGYTLPGAVGDRVWLDEDGDGIQDAGEDGIANATVELLNAGNVVVATTTTDINGGYLFTGVVPGAYTVRVASATLPAGLSANPTYDEDGIGTAHQNAVTMVPGGVHLTADFGYNWAPPPSTDNGTGTGAIGDRIWIDADGDGVQDLGEAGLGGITVTLYHDPDGNGVYDTLYNVGGYPPIRTTDAAGLYVFDELPAGAYAVVVTAPGGYIQTGDPDFFGETLAAGNRDDRTTPPIILAPGDVFVNADFGYQPTAAGSIGDRVWFDADADGVQDADEPGIPGVSVALVKDANGNGLWDAVERIVATTLTGTNGLYSFTGLPVADGAGTDDYLVWVSDTAGLLVALTPTYDLDGALPATGVKTGYGLSAAVNLEPSGTDLHDFGYTRIGQQSGRGLIGDRVWLDANGDGVQDAGEDGIAGVTVSRYASDGTTLFATTVTDANGNYFFGNLVDATYIVRVDTTTLPGGGTGLANTYDPDGGTENQSSVTISGGNINLLQDFGYRGTTPNTIGGTVWEDRNADGTRTDGSGGNPDETGNGVPGVTVVLYDSNSNGVGKTVTDASGNYLFTGLPDGTYAVDVTDEANRLAGWWHSDGPNDGSDNNSQPDPYSVSVSGGQTDTTGDFGYYVDPAWLGNRVWLEAGTVPNGQQDAGEIGLSNVLVRLTIIYPNGVTNAVATRSGADGYYGFGNLLLDEDYDGAGSGEPTFILSVLNPGGYYHTVHDQSGVPDSEDSDSAIGVLATTRQGAGPIALNVNPSLEIPQGWYDFGFTPIPTLAVVTAVRSRVEGGVAVVSWDVDLELDTAGYYLERWSDSAWRRVHTDLIPAQLFVPGTKTYEQADPGAPLGTVQRFRIVELDNQGWLIPYGPYELALDGGEVSYETWAAGIAWGGRASGRDADPDGDGLTNFQEYLAGTDPLSANSVLRVNRIEAVTGGVRVTWSSVPGRTYAVEMAPSLTQGFLAVTTGILAEAAETSTILPVSAEANAYFRVVVTQP